MKTQQTPTNELEIARREFKRADPLGKLPEVSHLLPDPAAAMMPKAKCEPGAKPLKNRKREAFCQALTGWGGDGKRIENYRAYEIAYGKSGSTARSESTHLLAIAEVRERVEWLERRVAEAKRHNYLAAQQSFDEFRLGLVEKAKINSKLAPLALAAARDFEKAHGLEQAAAAATITTTVEETAEVKKSEVLPGLVASLKRVVRTTRSGE